MAASSACRSKTFTLELSGRAAKRCLKPQERESSLPGWSECQEGKTLLVASSTGRMLRLVVNDANVPLMAKTAQGPVLMALVAGRNNRRSRLGFSGWRRAFWPAGMADQTRLQVKSPALV